MWRAPFFYHLIDKRGIHIYIYYTYILFIYVSLYIHISYVCMYHFSII